MLPTCSQIQKVSRAVQDIQKFVLVKNVKWHQSAAIPKALDREEMETRMQSVVQLNPQVWPRRHLSHFQDESLPVNTQMFHTSWTSSYKIISTFWYSSLWYLHHDFGMRQDERLTYLVPFCYCSWLAFHLSPGFVQSHDLPICCYLLCKGSSVFCLVCAYDKRWQ